MATAQSNARKTPDKLPDGRVHRHSASDCAILQPCSAHSKEAAQRLACSQQERRIPMDDIHITRWHASRERPP